MQQKTLIGIIIIAVVIVGGYLLWTGSQRQSELPEIVLPPSLETAPQELPQKEATAPEIREIAVSGKEFSFDPASITLSEGERVRVVFTNVGQAPHDFTIEGLGIKTQVIGFGQTDSIDFTVPASGVYTFFCSVAGHRQAGMEGDLTVE
ncbi:MAG: plastocyanin [Parcubacteria group bacterium Gr01-1014_30]|nr:MAG: plastocyanin [Parcubacteria group bacterium Gr01-1014_30]